MRGDWSPRPFALQLLEQHWNGKTVEQLSCETGIPSERIEMRLRAAMAYLQRLPEDGGTCTLLRMRRQTLQPFSISGRTCSGGVSRTPS
jgi:hypothetical protein